MAGRRYRGSVTMQVEAEVDVGEVLESIDTEKLWAEIASRGGHDVGASFDLLEEIAREIRLGRPAYALALIDSMQTAARIDDAKRQYQYQIAGRA